MTATLRRFNNSVSAVARRYAAAPSDGGSLIVWLELAPQDPKVIGAIWTSLVNGNAALDWGPGLRKGSPA